MLVLPPHSHVETLAAPHVTVLEGGPVGVTRSSGQRPHVWA